MVWQGQNSLIFEQTGKQSTNLIKECPVPASVADQDTFSQSAQTRTTRHDFECLPLSSLFDQDTFSQSAQTTTTRHDFETLSVKVHRRRRQHAMTLRHFQSKCTDDDDNTPWLWGPSSQHTDTSRYHIPRHRQKVRGLSEHRHITLSQSETPTKEGGGGGGALSTQTHHVITFRDTDKGGGGGALSTQTHHVITFRDTDKGGGVGGGGGALSTQTHHVITFRDTDKVGGGGGGRGGWHWTIEWGGPRVGGGGGGLAFNDTDGPPQSVYFSLFK